MKVLLTGSDELRDGQEPWHPGPTLECGTSRTCHQSGGGRATWLVAVRRSGSGTSLSGETLHGQKTREVLLIDLCGGGRADGLDGKIGCISMRWRVVFQVGMMLRTTEKSGKGQDR